MDWLFIQSEDAGSVAVEVREALHRLGYKDYDPFPGGTGTPPDMKTFVKAFAGPAHEGWVRIVGTLDPTLFEHLNTIPVFTRAWLTDSDGGITIYDHGAVQTPEPRPYLAPKAESKGNVESILPDNMRDLAGKVNMKQADQMMNRLSSTLFGKLDRQSGGEASAMQNQARAMLGGSNLWNSPGAAKLLGVAHVLPTGWRDPDFDTVREAYQVARLIQKNPNAAKRLLPDESAALKALPDAVTYLPIYLGR
jgi:hypothetical protein